MRVCFGTVMLCLDQTGCCYLCQNSIQSGEGANQNAPNDASVKILK